MTATEKNTKIYKDAKFVAEKIVNKINPDADIIFRDDFDEMFALAVRERLNVDNVWDITTLPNGDTVSDFETTVRGILSYLGWETETEGEDEGCLYKAASPAELERLKKVTEAINVLEHMDPSIFYQAIAFYEWTEIRKPNIKQLRRADEFLDQFDTIYDEYVRTDFKYTVAHDEYEEEI